MKNLPLMEIRLMVQVLFGVQLHSQSMEKFLEKLKEILAGTLMVEKNIKLTSLNLLRVLNLKVIKMIRQIMFGALLPTPITVTFLEKQKAITAGILTEERST